MWPLTGTGTSRFSPFPEAGVPHRRSHLFFWVTWDRTGQTSPTASVTSGRSSKKRHAGTIAMVPAFQDQPEIVTTQRVKPVIEEIQIEDVLPQNTGVKKPLHCLKQKGGLAAPPNANADCGLAAYGGNTQAAWHPRCQHSLLKIQEHGSNCVAHNINPVTIMTGISINR